MELEKELDDYIATLDECIREAEGLTKGRPDPRSRAALDQWIKELVQELKPSEKIVTKQEVRYLVNAYRLLRKVKEMRNGN